MPINEIIKDPFSKLSNDINKDPFPKTPDYIVKDPFPKLPDDIIKDLSFIITPDKEDNHLNLDKKLLAEKILNSLLKLGIIDQENIEEVGREIINKGEIDETPLSISILKQLLKFKKITEEDIKKALNNFEKENKKSKL